MAAGERDEYVLERRGAGRSPASLISLADEPEQRGQGAVRLARGERDAVPFPNGSHGRQFQEVVVRGPDRTRGIEIEVDSVLSTPHSR